MNTWPVRVTLLLQAARRTKPLTSAMRRANAARSDAWFVGRLATYRYYNMDQVVGQALSTFRRIQETLPAGADAQMPKEAAGSKLRSFAFFLLTRM